LIAKVAPNPLFTKGLKKVPSLKHQATATEAYCPYPQTSPRGTSLQGTFEPPHTPVLPALAVPVPSFSHSISASSEVPTPAPVEDRDEDIPDAPPPDSNSDPDSEPESEPSIVEDTFPRFSPPEPEPSNSESDDSDSEDDMPKPIE